MSTVVVTNATGLQGKTVAEELKKNNYQVRALTRDPSKVQLPGVEIVKGSFDDVDSLIKAFEGADGIYFKLPLLFDHALLIQYTKNFIAAALQTKPSLVVFNSSIFVPEKPTGYVAFDVKLEAEQLLKKSGLPVIYLHPRIYLDNIAAPWSVPAIIEQGVIASPVPTDQQVSWISVYDLARYTVAAFNNPKQAGKTFEIGAQSVTGKEIAETFSKILKKDLQYIYVSPDDFENGLKPVFGDHSAKSISDIYRYLRDNEEDFNTDNASASVLTVETLSLNQWISQVPWEQLHKQYSAIV